jgi:protein-tyrosine-phosphatase/predicted ATP-grasp superfamily ATP-dependent carboligase
MKTARLDAVSTKREESGSGLSSGCCLVLDAHSRAGLETVQALGRRGVAVDGASEQDNCLASVSHYTRELFRQPAPANTREFIGWLRELDRHRDYNLIVPSTEGSLTAFLSLASDDPLRKKAVLSDNEALTCALDKHKTAILASSLGIPVPRTTLIADLAEASPASNFPLILKPIQSVITRDGHAEVLSVAVVRNEDERMAKLKHWLPTVKVLEQEYLTGRGVGIELLFNRGEMIWHFAHERMHEYPLTGGASTYRRSTLADPEMLNTSVRLLHALRWHGVAMVEFKVAADGSFWLMEINPRFWGSLALAIDAGVNFPLGLFLLARGQSIPPQPEYKVPYYTRDLGSDIQWQLENLRASHRDPLLLTRPVLAALLQYLRPLAGSESWDHFDVHDLKPTLLILRRIASRYTSTLRRKWSGHRLRAQALSNHKRILQRISREAETPKSLLFLCYGNICRSPVAEALARRSFLKSREIQSAGFHPTEGRMMPDRTSEVVSQLGLDMSAHRSKRVTQEMVRRADLILVMDLENYAEVAREFPDAVGRTTLLGLFAPGGDPIIADPYLASANETARVVHQIETTITALAARFETVADTRNPAQAVG